MPILSRRRFTAYRVSAARCRRAVERSARRKLICRRRRRLYFSPFHVPIMHFRRLSAALYAVADFHTADAAPSAVPFSPRASMRRLRAAPRLNGDYHDIVTRYTRFAGWQKPPIPLIFIAGISRYGLADSARARRNIEDFGLHARITCRRSHIVLILRSPITLPAGHTGSAVRLPVISLHNRPHNGPHCMPEP